MVAISVLCHSGNGVSFQLNMSSSQEEKWSVLFGIGSLELVPQTELPLVLQLQADDGLAERIAILANHTQGGT